MAKRKANAAGADSGQEAREDASYEVGYGRPPRSGQFQKGRSGNPKGRPKGAKNLSTLVTEKLGAKVIVKEGGRTKRMSKGEIGITKLVNRFAETGDLKTMIAIHKLQEGGTAGGASSLPRMEDVLSREPSASDEDILQWYRETHRSSSKDETP